MQPRSELFGANIISFLPEESGFVKNLLRYSIDNL